MPPLNLYARVRFFVHVCTRDRGCSAHPAFPAPSDARGRKRKAKLGRIEPRECDGMHTWYFRLESGISPTSSRPICAIAHQEPGPILRGLSVRTQALDIFCNNKRRGVWVPAQGRDDTSNMLHSR